MNIKYFC